MSINGGRDWKICRRFLKNKKTLINKNLHVFSSGLAGKKTQQHTVLEGFLPTPSSRKLGKLRLFPSYLSVLCSQLSGTANNTNVTLSTRLLQTKD